jgi:hypothetical protein
VTRLSSRTVLVSVVWLWALSGSALAQVAPGAPRQTATITGTVVDSSGRPVANANVRLEGPTVAVVTSDMHGTFQFVNVTLGIYTIYVSADGYGASSKSGIIVVGDINVAVRYLAPPGLKTIAHVSTSGLVSFNVTPASIAELKPSNYAFQGVTSWRQIVEQIPGVAATGDTVSGFNTNDVIPDGPFQAVVLSINGAQPYETATLLDGMPLQNASFNSIPGAGVDLGTLPLNAFGTADIIRGPGAESPSILDSIGGTFDFHAPDPTTQNQYELSYADDAWGGFSSNAKVALHFGRFASTFTFGTWDSPGPIHRGEVAGEGFINMYQVNGQSVSCPTVATQPQWQDFGCFIYRMPRGINNYQGPAESTAVFCCVQDSTAWDTRSASGALSYRIGSNVVAQVFYAAADNRSLEAAFLEPFLLTTPDPGYTGSIAPGMQNFLNNPGNSVTTEADWLLEEKIRADVGQGVLQVAALQNYSYYNESFSYFPDGVYRAYGEACLGTPTGPPSPTPGQCSPGTTLTIFNGTPISARSYQNLYGLYDDWGWPVSRDLLINYDSQIGSSTTAGVSFLKSSYDYPWMYLYTKFPAINGGAPPSDSETSKEWRLHISSELSDKLYANLSWYVTSGDFHVPDPMFVQNLEHPGHYTDALYPYSAPRLALVWRASPDVAIRASAGGGYALPVLANIIGSNGAPICSLAACAVTLTNISLQPEKAFGIDIGSDLRLNDTTAISLDVYRTNLYGMFFESSAFQGLYHGLPLLVSQYRNLPPVRMEGVDLSVQHNVPQGIYWHGSFGLTRSYVVSVPAGFYNNGGTCQPYTGLNCANTQIVPGTNFTGAGLVAVPAAVPYANGYGDVGYRWTPQTYVQIEADYFGKNNSYYEPPFTALNAYAGYGLTRHVTLIANFQNLTCAYCLSYEQILNYPRLIAPASPGQLPYGLYALPYGPRVVTFAINFRY